MEHVDVIIVGAGQAGLAVSHELNAAGVDHVVLERGRVGETWRRRWDTFCLVSPNWTLQLPGRPYSGPDPDGYLPRDEIVATLEDYAGSFGAPVREGVTVTGAESSPDGGFILHTTAGDLGSRALVPATGGFQRPHRPAAADTLPIGLPQMDVDDYRSEAALPPGRVLVVGSGQSGAQISEELREAGREVVLACGKAPWVPRRLGGRDIVWWLAKVGFFDQTVETLPTPAARLIANPIATGHGGGHDLHLRTLQAMGVTLTGHFLGMEGGLAHFAPDLHESAAWGDQRFRDVMGLIQRFATEHGLEVPPFDEPEAFARPRARMAGPLRLRRRHVRRGLPPGLPLLASLARGVRRARLPAPARRRQYGRPRAVLRGRPLHAHAKVLALPGRGRGRNHRLPSRRRLPAPGPRAH